MSPPGTQDSERSFHQPEVFSLVFPHLGVFPMLNLTSSVTFLMFAMGGKASSEYLICSKIE